MRIINQEIVETKVSELKVHPDNPRQGNVDDIANSIEVNGFYGVIVAQKSSGYVLAGNHRLKAAKAQNATKIPVAFVDCTDEQAKRIMLADNRLSDLSTYSEEILAGLLKELSESDLGLDGTGYDESFLDELAGIVSGENDGLTDPDDVPEVTAEPVTKNGDLWFLGEHRLLCGDSTKREDIQKLLSKSKADMLHTDPPYGVDYEGVNNDHLKSDKLREFLHKALSLAYEFMKPGSNAYVWFADFHSYEVFGAFRDAGFKQAKPSTIHWVKDSLVLSQGDYHLRNEPCLYGWKEGKGRVRVKDRKQDTLWEFARPKKSDAHPTMKPVELCKRAIENSSKPNSIVLDLFGGSGSTLIACEKINRKAYLVEMDPVYCDVIVTRWEEYTGKKAKREQVSTRA